MSTPAPGMGAVPTPHGTSFRVWAPHAEAVWVKGDFNGWADHSHPLTLEGDGHWAVHVDAARVGQGYKFRLAHGGQEFDRINPRARQVSNSVGHGVIHDPAGFDWGGDDFAMPSHNELVIYELHIGSFLAREDGAPGTFDDVVSRLGHLKRLGVNALQIMPVAEFAGDFSWGYNPAHVFAVESAYGGPGGLRNFVRAVHAAGMAVILDVVYNHFGPSDLDLWRFDGWHENERGGIYFYNDERAATPWGETRPDYGRREVRQFIRDNALMWLEEYRIDGLRLDMTLYMRTRHGHGDGSDDLHEGWTLMQWLADEVHGRHPGKILIAEDLRNLPQLTQPTAEGGAGFDAQWDANFVHPVRAAVVAPEDGHRSMHAVCDALLHRSGGDAFNRVVYSESHDEVANGKARVPHEIHADDATGWFAQKRSTLAAALVLTAPGIPMLFQGQEFLQGEWFRDDVPLDWDQSVEYLGIVRLYRDLVRLRLNRDGTSRGLQGQFINVFHVDDSVNVLAFQRWDQHGAGDDVVVVVNFSAETLTGYALGLPCASVWRVRFNSDSSHYSPDFGNAGVADVEARPEARDGLDAQGVIDLPPYSALILSQDR